MYITFIEYIGIVQIQQLMAKKTMRNYTLKFFPELVAQIET